MAGLQDAGAGRGREEGGKGRIFSKQLLTDLHSTSKKCNFF